MKVKWKWVEKLQIWATCDQKSSFSKQQNLFRISTKFYEEFREFSEIFPDFRNEFGSVWVSKSETRRFCKEHCGKYKAWARWKSYQPTATSVVATCSTSSTKNTIAQCALWGVKVRSIETGCKFISDQQHVNQEEKSGSFTSRFRRSLWSQSNGTAFVLENPSFDFCSSIGRK